jgi:hypothetical protein
VTVCFLLRATAATQSRALAAVLIVTGFAVG